MIRFSFLEVHNLFFFGKSKDKFGSKIVQILKISYAKSPGTNLFPV
jgi:hypothetical protein